MKLNLLGWLRDDGETLATFGEARLIKKLSGKIELIGGSADDRASAKEWASLFLHEAIVALVPPQSSSELLRLFVDSLL